MRTKVSIRQGARYAISQIGYYNFWYPSDSEAEQGFLEEKIDGEILTWQCGGKNWTPVLVTEEVARKYKSPIKVLWIDKEELINV